MPATRKAPSANSISASAASSMCAAIGLAWSTIFSDARRTADPPSVAEREPPVPPPIESASESPSATRSVAGSRPSVWATICL